MIISPRRKKKGGAGEGWQEKPDTRMRRKVLFGERMRRERIHYKESADVHTRPQFSGAVQGVDPVLLSRKAVTKLAR